MACTCKRGLGVLMPHHLVGEAVQQLNRGGLTRLVPVWPRESCTMLSVSKPQLYSALIPPKGCTGAAKARGLACTKPSGSGMAPELQDKKGTLIPTAGRRGRARERGREREREGEIALEVREK